MQGKTNKTPHNIQTLGLRVVMLGNESIGAYQQIDTPR